MSARTTATTRTNATAKVRLSVPLDTENFDKLGLPRPSYTVTNHHGKQGLDPETMRRRRGPAKGD